MQRQMEEEMQRQKDEDQRLKTLAKIERDSRLLGTHTHTHTHTHKHT
jgi:hypothetical protein